MSQQITMYIIAGMWAVLSGILGFGATRIFNKLDEIAKKFEAIGESFGRVYKDIHLADEKIWEKLHEIDKDLAEVKARCDGSCRK